MLSGWPRQRLLRWIALLSAAGFVLCFLLAGLTGIELDSMVGALGAVFGAVSILLTVLQLSAPGPPGPIGAVADDLAGRVRSTWLAEAAARDLHGSGVLPLSWDGADDLVGGSGVKVSPGRLDGDFDTAMRSLATAYRAIPDGRLVVLGEPGAGKTVIALLLTLGLLERRGSGEPVPVLLSLSSWDPTSVSLETWITKTLAATYYDGTSTVPRDLLIQGLLLPVLDGLDEIPEAARAIAVSGINKANGGKRPVVLTCRLAEFVDVVDGGGPVLRRAAPVRVCPVDADDVVNYIAAGDNPGWKRVFAELRRDPHGPLAGTFRSPLMVAVARTTYAHEGTDPAELLGFDGRYDLENHLLDKLVETACPEHRQRRYLTYLARHLHGSRARDLIWWQLSDQVKESSSLWIGIAAAGLAFALPSYWLIRLFSVPLQDVAPAWSAAIFACLVLGGMALGRTTYPPGRLAFSMPRFGSGRSRAAEMAGSFAFAMAVAVPLLFLVPGQGWSYFRVSAYTATVAAALAAWAVARIGVAAHDSVSHPPKQARNAEPLVLLRDDRASALAGAALSAVVVAAGVPLAGLFVVLCGFLAQTLTGWPGEPGRPDLTLLAADLWNDVTPDRYQNHPELLALFSLLAGLCFGVTLLMTRTWTRFLILRSALALQQRLPFRLLTFLEDARARHLLRRSGGVYQFRHVRLQERLATQEPPTGLGDPEHRGSVVQKLWRLATEPALIVTLIGAAVLAVWSVAVETPRVNSSGVLTGLDEDVAEIVTTADGHTVVAAGNGHVGAWHADRHEPLMRITDRGGIGVMAVAPDGRTVAFAGEDRNNAGLWQTGTGERVAPLDPGGATTAISYGSDGRFLATVTGGGVARVWDADSGARVDEVDVLRGATTGLVFAPDGKSFAAFSAEDERLLLRHPGNHAADRLLSVSADDVGDVAFAPKGDLLAATDGRTVRLWNSRTGKPVRDLTGESEVRDLVFAPGGGTVAARTSGGAILWDVLTGKVQQRLTVPGTQDQLGIVRFSADGRLAAAAVSFAEEGSIETGVRLWDLRTGRVVADMLSGNRFDSGADPEDVREWWWAFSPDGGLIAMPENGDDVAVLRETTTGQVVRRLSGHTGNVTAGIFTPDGRTLLTGSTDHTVRRWALSD
ncbi:hypothetical protein [Actinoplanes sp. GCM10030250]|uniref:NACHT and WD40 repeat domain-containing protein n=1 Tax=Actinoplanes sp. GCM10030250 TaxID=3273376 RepID=UPI00360D5A2C